MLPRIDAHESMRDAERVLIGSGVGDRSVRREILRGWQRAAERPSDRAARRKTPLAAAALQAQAMGITVKIHGR